jgi:hypothetical protein
VIIKIGAKNKRYRTSACLKAKMLFLSGAFAAFRKTCGKREQATAFERSLPAIARAMADGLK